MYLIGVLRRFIFKVYKYINKLDKWQNKGIVVSFFSAMNIKTKGN